MADNPDQPAKPGPFAGLRVVDLTTVIVGPYTGMLLGDLGADVVKIEPPTGDLTRGVGPSRSAGLTSHYMNVNRNKRSLVLDLKQAKALEAMYRLVKGADIFVHNMRPEPLARLGCDYQALSAVNPRLIFCGIAGFGQGGRYAGQPAYDDVIQGASGLAALQHKVTGKPGFVGMLIADKTTALFAAYATSAALFARERTGEGQEIEVPMFESMTSFVMIEHLYGRSFEPALGTTGSPRHATGDRRPFATKDGFICVLPGGDHHWEAFFGAAGRPDLMLDSRFATRQARVENRAAAVAVMDELLKAKTTDQWLGLLREADVPAMPIIETEDLIDDPHLRDVGFFNMIDHPIEGMLRLLGVPMRFTKTPGSIRRIAPRLGEHSAEILAEIGYGAGEIEAMIRAGVTRVATP
ncbi:MAG: CoA transferase [Alphaproteobacteria bacterium]|nr:CoA transferase [Alphaproteobacteria bacterium]